MARTLRTRSTPQLAGIAGFALAAVALVFAAACPARAADPAPAPRVYVDEDYDFRLTPPPGWQRASPARVSVPGEVCRVWTPDGTTSITAFIQKPGKAMNPWALLDGSVRGLEKAGSQVVEREVRTVAGMRAMWLVTEGDGTGGAMIGKGAVRTRQHWVAVPREADVLVLLLIAPADSWPISDTAFQAMLDTLQVGGRQTDAQRRQESAGGETKAVQ